MSVMSKWWIVAVALAVGLAPVSEAHAQSRPSPVRAGPVDQAGREGAAKVSVDLMVIYAHKQDNKVDPALRDVMPQLRSLPYTGYKLIGSQGSQLGVGQESLVPIPGGKKIKVNLIDRNDTQAKVRIRMLNGDRVSLDTTVSIHRDKAFIIAGPAYEQGKLILPVSVEY